MFVLASLSACRSAERSRGTVDPDSQRNPPVGAVVGFRGEYDSHTWLGIPYAAPPIGDLRWREPQRAARWEGVREALIPGSPCVQYASPFGGVAGKSGQVVGQENCLFLNIWAPRVDPSHVPEGKDRWPVMVWIHGGGNSIGDGGFYNGGNLAATHKVVVLSFNYRLGPFGWLRHASLREGASNADASGNFGTLDIIAALRWVRENISAFGGDPDRVTVFGESAGGRNVYTMLLSPLAHGLFHRAIAQSGSTHLTSPEDAENLVDDTAPGSFHSSGEMALRLLQHDRTAKDRDGARLYFSSLSRAEQARYLRGKSAEEIIAGYDVSPTGMILMPLVFRDGTVLPSGHALKELSRKGGYNEVPFIAGTNRDENKLFMFPSPEWVRRWLWIIPRVRDERLYNLTAEYLSKLWKARGADEPAMAMERVQGPSVFVYRFDWDEEPHLLGADLSMMLGAAHGLEIPFVFGHFDLGRAANMIFTAKNEAGRQQLSADMMSYWAQFAYTGSPGRGRDGRLPEWTAWDGALPETPKFMVLDTHAGGGLRMSNENVTRESVLAALAADPRVTGPRMRCVIYHEVIEWERDLTPADYSKFEECRDFPYDRYPWP